MENAVDKIEFNRTIILIGFGCVANAVMPLLFRHLNISPSQIKILAPDAIENEVTKEYNLAIQHIHLNPDNYKQILSPLVKEGDMILNLSVDVCSASLINFCFEKRALYLDTSIEPWQGGYVDTHLSPADRTNYYFRESVLHFKNRGGPTALVTHGANPGLISHLVKQALLNIAKDNNLSVPVPKTKTEWATLAKDLQIKAIHVAERDTQISKTPRQPGEFRNTWSVDGLISEGLQPAELSWGTHEKHWPSDAREHTKGTGSAIYLNRPGISTRVRTWAPTLGAYHGFLITHGESISLGDYFSLKQNNTVVYRPTIHYAYLPSPDTVLSVHECNGNEWSKDINKQLVSKEITEGSDELGVLLMGNPKGAYWFGSQLTIHQARELIPHNSATSLQIASGVMGGLLWVHHNPDRGLVEPEEMDFEFVLNFARPYLGKLAGYYTDWTPLQHRNSLFPEEIDQHDPWQFVNIRVN